MKKDNGKDEEKDKKQKEQEQEQERTKGVKLLFYLDKLSCCQIVRSHQVTF